MWKDFKEFAFQGNVFDLAVAVVIGAAFGKIVSSLVENLIMPLFGALFGGVNFSHLEAPVNGVQIPYGVFIQSIIDFLIIAFVIFMVVRVLSKFKKKEEVQEEAPVIDQQEVLLAEIRDLLKKQAN